MNLISNENAHHGLRVITKQSRLGHILARAEIRVLTEEWVERIPSFSTKSAVRHGFRIGLVHAIESLPLRWDVVSLPQE